MELIQNHKKKAALSDCTRLIITADRFLVVSKGEEMRLVVGPIVRPRDTIVTFKESFDAQAVRSLLSVWLYVSFFYHNITTARLFAISFVPSIIIAQNDLWLAQLC